MSTSNSLKKTIAQKIREILKVERPWFRTIVRTIWILFFCFIIGFPFYIYSVSIDLFGLYGGMPSLKSIENPENDLSSELISADGVSLGRYFRYNRSQVTFDQLSPDLINTLVHSEDHRFYEHSGLDFYSFIRVFYGIFTFKAGVKGGGSTISQQVAKNLFDTRGDELSGSVKFPGPL